MDATEEQINDILNSAEYFECERMHTRMKRQVCINRQRQGKPSEVARTQHTIPEECRNCEQGKKILEEEMAKSGEILIHIDYNNSSIAKYPKVMDQLERLAMNQVRSVPDQALYYILRGIDQDDAKK